MFRRIYGIAVFVAALVLCASVLSYAHSRPSGADTLVLWVMDQDINTGSALQKMMRKFTHHSGIPVKVRFLDWGSAFAELNKILPTEAGDGTDYPDVLQLGSTWVPYFANAGLIAPVSNLVKAVDTSRFYPEAMRAAHIGRDSVVYAFPWFLDVRGFFANERLWLELGLHDSEIETYSQFYGVLRAVSEARVRNQEDVKVVPFEFGVKDDWTGYQQLSPFLWNFGGDFVVETDSGYRSALADPQTLDGLRHYLKLLLEQDFSPYNLKENSSQSAERFVRSEQLILFGTSEFIRKIELENELGGLMDTPIAKDGLITVKTPGGPFGMFSFVGGSHLVLPKNANPAKLRRAHDLFLFMLRADNIDYYSRHSGFIPPDKSLIRIWMQDDRYCLLIDGLDHHGRSSQNIPEWSEIEMMVNSMVNDIGKKILDEPSDIIDEITMLVYETHLKINRRLGYVGDSNLVAAKERIHLALQEPVEETPYEKPLGAGNRGGFSLRLVIMISLGVVAIVLLVVCYFVFFRRH